jgi:polyhydroxybutyrate depolymerase
MKPQHFVWFVGLLTWSVAASAADDNATLASGTHDLTLTAAGHEWHYHLHIPPKHDATKPTPLVLILHGAGGNGTAYLNRAGWAKKADAAGFIAVAPDGLAMRPDQEANFLTNPHLWQSGQLAATSPRGKIDDVTFFKALLDDVGRRVNGDRERVYVTGHSNGGGMTFRLGAELPERFAAIAVVASLPWVKDPRPSRPLPTLYLVGTGWPGGQELLPARLMGPRSDKVNATDLIWEFFEKHTRGKP